MTTEPQHRSRKRATPAAEGDAGREQTMTATELQEAALRAIDGYGETTAALSVVDERIRELRTDPGPPPPTVADLAGCLMRGEELPDIGELGAAITEHEGRVAARTREQQLLTSVRDELDRTRQLALRSGTDAAFGYLDRQLHELLDRGRAIVARLGTVRTADEALDAERPTEARDALRQMQALAGEYATLREAQVLLVGHADDHARTPRSLTWAEQVALVRDHGTVSNPAEVGTPPTEPFDQLVWLLDKDPAPIASVPGLRELRRRADAARPARPPSPATDDQEPLLNAAGTTAQREHRTRVRAGLGPRI